MNKVLDLQLQRGLETAFLNSHTQSNLAYRPEFVSNDLKQGKNVLAAIEQELRNCEEFYISVAFISRGGLTPLLQILNVKSVKIGTNFP